MNKKHEPSVILKTLILIFCIINVIALFLVLKHEKQTQNNAQVISYDVTEEEAEEEPAQEQEGDARIHPAASAADPRSGCNHVLRVSGDDGEV